MQEVPQKGVQREMHLPEVRILHLSGPLRLPQVLAAILHGRVRVQKVPLSGVRGVVRVQEVRENVLQRKLHLLQVLR